MVRAYQHREISHAPGVLIKDLPEQSNPTSETPKILKLKKGIAEPIAVYKIKARVLSTERYWWDAGASVAPLDVAVGWGPMSDSSLLDKLTIEQHNRFYFYHWSQEDVMDPETLKNNSANMHMIPANDSIKEILFALRPGHLVEFTGYLVRVSGYDGGEWKSSLSRDDTGPGACELMWVQTARILDSESSKNFF